MLEGNKKIEISNRLFALLLIFILWSMFLGMVRLVFDKKNLPENYPKEVTISAEGRTLIKPEVALIRLGVISEGGINIQELVKENSNKMKSILSEIKKIGIEDKDIETVNYNLTPRYEYLSDEQPQGKRNLIGYCLENEIKVKIRDFNKVTSIIEKSTSKGANKVGNLEYIVENKERAKMDAACKAIENAKVKAVLLARQSGLKLEKLINIFEEYEPSPEQTYGTGGDGNESKPSLMQLGYQEIISHVQLVYRVR